METLKTASDLRPDLPRPAVVCTLVKITGSAPQHVGAKMWVTADSFIGTIGGGRFELEVLKDARALLADGGAARLKEYVLCKEMGQCCGGRVEVFFDPVPGRRSVHLFGGGHVGRATAQVLSDMELDIVLVDPRPEWSSPKGLPDGVRTLCADPVEYASHRTWQAADAACIFTHSHDLDMALAERLLPLPLGYIGLIGSEHKADVFLARLKTKGGRDWEGLWEERMHCPIGMPLDSKNPKVIAVSIAAELLKDWALVAPQPKVAPL